LEGVHFLVGKGQNLYLDGMIFYKRLRLTNRKYKHQNLKTVITRLPKTLKTLKISMFAFFFNVFFSKKFITHILTTNIKFIFHKRLISQNKINN